jgi:hypothetical protein
VNSLVIRSCGVGLALGLLGCSAAPVRAPAPSSVSAAAVPAPVPWEAVVVPWNEPRGPRPVRLGDDADGSALVAFGGLRARVRGERVEWAPDAMLLPLLAWARDGVRWYFASEDGAVFRAEGFLGPLVPLGGTGGLPIEAGFVSTGRLAVRTPDGRLWFGGPDDRFEPARLPGEGRLIDAGFVDRDFGVVVLEPGGVWRTTDGGAHFDPVDLGAHATHTIYPQADGVVLATTDGLRFLGPSGAAVPFHGVLDRGDLALPSESARAVEESRWSEHPLGYASLLSAPGVQVLADGRIARMEGQDVVIRGREGTLARLELPARGCGLRAWGERVLAWCRTEAFETTLQISDGEHPWRELRSFPRLLDTVVTSRDGAALVVPHACEGEGEGERDATPVCWYDGVAWRTRMLPQGAQLLGVSSDALLYRLPFGRREETWPIHRLSLDDTDEGARLRLAVPEARLLSAEFTREGLVAGVARVGRELFTVLGPGEQPLPLHPLPSGAQQVAFADATHGIAVGAQLGQVWTSTDGARTWTPLTVPLEGDRAVPLRPGPELERDRERNSAVAVSCSARACTVGSRLVWMAPSSPRTGAVVRAAARASSWEPWVLARTAGSGQGLQPGGFAVESPSPGASGTLPPTRVYGGDGWLETPEGTSGPRRFTWGGTDEQGRFRARSQEVDLEPLALPSGTVGSDGVFLPRLLTRSLAVLERCVRDDGYSRCDLLVVPREGRPRLLGAPLDPENSPVVQGALALPDGGAAVHLRTFLMEEDQLVRWRRRRTNERMRADLVLRLDARGEIVAQRGFAWGVDPVARMLTRTTSGPGLAVSTWTDPRALTFFGMDPRQPARPLVTLPPERMAPCAGPARGEPQATVVSVSANRYGPRVTSGRFELEPPYFARPLLELDAHGGVCVRGVSFWSLDPRDDNERAFLDSLGGVPRLRASGGTMQAVGIDAARDTALRCYPHE